MLITALIITHLAKTEIITECCCIPSKQSCYNRTDTISLHYIINGNTEDGIDQDNTYVRDRKGGFVESEKNRDAILREQFHKNPHFVDDMKLQLMLPYLSESLPF